MPQGSLLILVSILGDAIIATRDRPNSLSPVGRLIPIFFHLPLRSIQIQDRNGSTEVSKWYPINVFQVGLHSTEAALLLLTQQPQV